MNIQSHPRQIRVGCAAMSKLGLRSVMRYLLVPPKRSGSYCETVFCVNLTIRRSTDPQLSLQPFLITVLYTFEIPISSIRSHLKNKTLHMSVLQEYIRVYSVHCLVKPSLISFSSPADQTTFDSTQTR